MPTPPAPRSRPRRIALWASLAGITAIVVVALITSAPSGTGASDIGDRGDPVEQAPAPAPAPSGETTAGETTAGEESTAEEPARNCEATESNPGGTNNYIPDAPLRDDLGRGFVIAGSVRSAAGCRPLEGVRIQVWLATATGGEQDNRASVLTDADGRFRIRTAPTVPQFGEPNIHVAYDGDRFRPVFIRRVVDLEDTRATVNLTLARDR